MADGESRLRAAVIRRNLREIDAKVRAIHAEQRLYRRYNFGLDVQEIALSALRVERAELVDQLRVARSSPAGNRERSAGIRPWLVLPFALGALAIQALQPKRRPSRTVSSPRATALASPSVGPSAPGRGLTQRVQQAT
jgi:hypothetical protein